MFYRFQYCENCTIFIATSFYWPTSASQRVIPKTRGSIDIYTPPCKWSASAKRAYLNQSVAKNCQTIVKSFNIRIGYQNRQCDEGIRLLKMWLNKQCKITDKQCAKQITNIYWISYRFCYLGERIKDNPDGQIFDDFDNFIRKDNDIS